MWHIVSTGWKCDEQVRGCAESIGCQTGVDWRWYATMDGGTVLKDDTREFLTAFDGDTKRFSNGYAVYVRLALKNMGAMYWLADMLDGIVADDNDRVAIVDLDDKLARDDALAIAERYHAAGAWVTTGSYDTASGRPARFQGPYSASENVRNSKWKASHLRTFRLGLWRRIRKRTLKGHDGQWIRTAWDLAMLLPMIEMAGVDRVAYIPEVLYTYNDTSPLNDHKLRREEQKRTERYIRRLPPYKRVEVL